MKRTLACAAALAALISTTLIAERASAQTIDAGLTTNALHTSFRQAGFEVDAPITWWTNRVTTFTARDSSRDRIALVLIFPTVEAAQAERLQAAARDGDGSLANQHPHLVPGYGYSEWRGNTAIVEANLSQLNALYAALNDEAAYRGGNVDSPMLALYAQRTETSVDVDLIALLDNQLLVNL